jgi:phospholipase/lecithinase/hemolysin
MMIERQRIAVAPVRWTLHIALAAVLASSPSVSAQSRFSAIVVFGTSLSDPGNAFALEGDAATPPDFTVNALLVPAAPYAKGGHHFSNGATWIEQFARSVGLSASVRAALLEPNATNYAVGAARAYDDGVNINLSRQVDLFLMRLDNVASAQALYVIEMGSNDIRDAFALYATGGDGAPILALAIGAVATNIQRLYAAGAREFLVWVAPNVALTPAIRSLPPAAQNLAGQLTQVFNTNLATVLAQLLPHLPGATFTRLDAYRLLNAIVASPGAFSNVTSACLTPHVAPFSCADADSYLFWDGIHPTKAGHAILATETAAAVQ